MFLTDIAVIIGLSFVFSIALLGYYQPKINKMKNTYEDFNSKMRDKLNNMTESEKQNFLSNLSDDTREFFEDVINNNTTDFNGIHQFHLMNDYIHDAHIISQDTNLEFQDFSQWAMNESIKAVTPFDHGGYVQGVGFNPSDTMMYHANNDMNNMHQDNHSMDMHNHNMDMQSHSHDSFNGF